MIKCRKANKLIYIGTVAMAVVLSISCGSGAEQEGAYMLETEQEAMDIRGKGD
ncbi:MAG: hypothetical protein K2I96_03330 [Lachnospiraceae bacterium]|nr:hypothetical protein [Lachnospiraceae bacterium]